MKVGIHGIGMIYEYHLNGFRAADDVKVTGACRDFYGDEDQHKIQRNKLEAVCNRDGIRAYRHFDEMVEDPRLDAIVITSINPYHYDQIIRALDHEKHVLIEKPVVTEINQVSFLEKRTKETGFVIFPAHNFVYRGAVQKARSIIESGQLGRVTYASFISSHLLRPDHVAGWRSKKELGAGGALIDSGHHQVYQSLYLMGMPKQLHGFTSKLVQKHMDCEDIAQINLRYADSALGCIMMSWTSNYNQGIEGIRVLGTDGNVIITDACYHNGEIVDQDASYENSFVNQAKAFIQCIREGGEPISTLDDVRKTLQIVYGAYQSSEKNEVICF